MATLHTLHLTPSPSFNYFTTLPTKNFTIFPTFQPPIKKTSLNPRRRSLFAVRAYKVLIEHDEGTTELEVDSDETILSKALDSGLSIPHDCKLGVCMTCPARLLDGSVDQTEGMLSDDVIDRGYALMCVAYPRSDCHVRVIPEEELLSLQLATSSWWQASSFS